MNPQSADFLKELKNLKAPVWKKIQEYLPQKPPLKHYRMVREYPERQGKYFRPGLVLLGARMFGGQIKQAILTAAAMQVSEDWLLIHDDVEDHSEERRHKPALNKIYGDELAINAGDALHVIMWKMLGDNVRFFGNEIGWKIYDKMTDILLTTAEGQFMELNWVRNSRVDIGEKDYYKMIYAKAGYYTVTGPLQLGAMSVGMLNRGGLKKIEEWAVPFGCAFQIWDDVMNITVDSEKQGKEKGGDILEGKRTLMLIHLLNNSRQVEKDYVAAIYSKPREQKTTSEKDYVLELMEKYKSIEYAKRAAINFAKKAKKIFDKNTANLPDSKAKQLIRTGVDFVVNRER